MRITIGGTPVSGKGTAGRLLAKELEYEYWSAGDVWRAEAEKRGMTLIEFHGYLTANPAFDHELDERQAALSERDDIIIDSRLGFHFVKNSVTVYLTVNIDVAAARLLAAMQDAAGAAGLDRIALALGVVWVVDLVCLVIALALALLTAPNHAPLDDVMPNSAERREPTDDASN